MSNAEGGGDAITGAACGGDGPAATVRHERFSRILAHRRPDRVPFYFPAIACTVASKILGRPVHSGGASVRFAEECAWLEGEEAHREFVRELHEVTVELHRKLDADIVRETWRSRERPTRRIDRNTLLFERADGSYRIKRFFPENQTYGVVVDTTGPRDTGQLAARLKAEMDGGGGVTGEELETLYRDQRDLKALADPYFPTVCGGAGLCIPMYDPVWLEASLVETELLADYFQYRAEIHVRHIRWLAEKGFRWINGGGDLAGKKGPAYSPRTFRAIMAAPLRTVVEACKRHGMVYCFRSDGNLWSLLDCFVHEGHLEALGEVDREASMTVGDIHRQYPGLIVLGNVNSSTLAGGSVRRVRSETRAGLEESGGLDYIAGPSNAILHGTPPENIHAMIEEIRRYRPDKN